MKFVSKNANLRIVLKHGIPAEPITGRNAIPSVSIKFENGIVNINDEETMKMMKAHSGFGSDFVSAEDGEDIYAKTRKQNEPEHDIQEIEHGSVKKNLNPAKPTDTMSIEQKRFFEEMVKETAKKIAIPLAKELAKKVILDMEGEKDESLDEYDNSNEKENGKKTENDKSKTTDVPPRDISDTSEGQSICETCGYVAKNVRALAAHRRFDKDCIALRP